MLQNAKDGRCVHLVDRRATPPRARQSNKLTARQIASAKPGRHGDGGGLYLVVSRTGARKWIFRFTSGGKPNEMGVGGAAVMLAQARDRAADARKFVASGVNPITARREARMASAAKPTFGQCAEAPAVIVSRSAISSTHLFELGRGRHALQALAASLFCTRMPSPPQLVFQLAPI
jgi:hypothetical protein